MPEDVDPAGPDRRAQWVALRTLRQRATAVGETDQGSTIYEVRSERLVLPAGAAHFKRLLPCANCGRDAVGSAVVSVADLDRVPNAVYCLNCGRSHLSSARSREEPIGVSAPPVAEEERPEPAGAADADRLAEVAASVERVRSDAGRLAESNRALVDAQRQLAQRMDALAAQVAAAAQPADDAKAIVARAMTLARADMRAMIDAEVHPLRLALSEGLEHGRSEIASLEKRVESESVALAGLDVHARELRRLQEAVESMAGRLEDLSQDRSAHRDLAAAHRELALRHEELEQRTAGHGLDDLRSEIAALRGRVDDESTRTAALLAALRTELSELLEEAVQQAGQDTLAALGEPLRTMAKAHDELMHRADRLAHGAELDREEVAALRAAIEAGADRLRELEARLSALKRSVRLEDRLALEIGRETEDALEFLEVKLRGAEERLAQL